MGIALVGAPGTFAPFPGGEQAPLTPPWGTGSSRSSGNLLICWVSGISVIETTAPPIPPTPAGWTLACSTYFVIEDETDQYGAAAIFYKVATGGDAAPTLAFNTSGNAYQAMLAEFSGASVVSPLEQTAFSSVGGTGFPEDLGTENADANLGNLFISATMVLQPPGYTSTVNTTPIFSNGNPTTTVDDLTGVSTTGENFFLFSYGVNNTEHFTASGVTLFPFDGQLQMATSFASFRAVANLQCEGRLITAFSAKGTVQGTCAGTMVATFTGLAEVTNGLFPCSGTFLPTFMGAAAATSVRLPPLVPQPTLHGLSGKFLSTVATSHRWLAKVEVRTAAGDLIADITNHVTGGSVTVDETAEIRRTCQVVLDGDESLVPPQVLTSNSLALGEMLHPAKGNELWIYRGVRYSDGTTEFAQLGVFRMSKPSITDDGQNITITINGNDRASVVARQSWQIPFTVSKSPTNPLGLPGGNLANVVQQVLHYLLQGGNGGPNIYPNLQYHLSNDFAFLNTIPPVPFTYPVTTFGADPTSVSDPMSDLITFCAAAGAELFFDVQGNVVLRPIAVAANAIVIDSVHFAEGDNCTMDSLDRTLDETTAYNGVILYCQGTGNAGPFIVKVWDTNADSPTYYQGPWGQVPYIMTTTLIPAGGDLFPLAQQKGFNMASKQLQLILGSMDSVNLTCVPNPALQEGDCVEVRRDRMQVNDPYIISQMTIPLDPAADMSITFRPRIQAA